MGVSVSYERSTPVETTGAVMCVSCERGTPVGTTGAVMWLHSTDQAVVVPLGREYPGHGLFFFVY